MASRAKFAAILTVLLVFLSGGTSQVLKDGNYGYSPGHNPLRKKLSEPVPYPPSANLLAGNTFDECEAQSDCNGARSCLAPDDSFCRPGQNCFCTPASFTFCLSDSGCPSGEICADPSFRLRRICVSPNALRFTIFRRGGPPLRPPESGLELSACSTDSQCQGARTCSFLYGNPFVQPCSGRQPCYCLTSSLPICFTSEDCPKGEVCANTPISRDRPTCVAAEVEKNLLSVEEIPITLANSEGYTLDPCRQNSQCIGNRRCVQLKLDIPGLPPCQGSSCVCLPTSLRFCASSDDCSLQEVCAETGYFSAPSQFCVSLDARAAYDAVYTVTSPIVCPTLISKDPPVRALVQKRTRIAQARIGNGLSRSHTNDSQDLMLPSAVDIVGGREANDNLLRRVVGLSSSLGFCSGVVISSRWVLTAAHCEMDGSSTASFLSRTAFSRKAIVRDIKRCFAHPKFHSTPGNYEFDIAVCELNSPAPSGVLPMSLNCNAKVPGDGMPSRSIGFGRIEFGQAGDPVLRQVDTRTVNLKKCSNIYRTEAFRGIGVTQNQLCSGSLPRGGCGTW